MSSRPAALRVLADLARSGSSLRAALIAWHEDVDDPELRKLSQMLRLGAAAPHAIEVACRNWGPDAVPLALIVRLAERMGGDAAAMFEQLATSIHDRVSAARGGRAAAAGAVLSGRMVAGLPLAFLPLTPMAHAPLFDGPGLVLLVTGLACAVGGMTWIGRLVPRPPTEDPVVHGAEVLSALVRGGVALPVALDEVAGSVVTPAFDRTRRLVRLGCTWTYAMQRSEDRGLVTLAATIERAERTGMPIAGALLQFAERRRRDAWLAFDAATKKAPVLMVVPLVLCVLPSFCLLALAPFLRGLTFSA
ncbi:MAG: type II secretion system F family protein [Actinomycetota bacterium]